MHHRCFHHYFKTDKESGMALSEFVIVMPIIMLLIALTVAMNSFLDQKIQSEVAVFNLSFGQTINPGEELLSVAPNATGTSNDHRSLARDIAHLNESMLFMGTQEMNDGNVKADMRMRFRTPRDEAWLKERDLRLGKLPATGHKLFDEAHSLEAEATSIGLRVLDQLKKPFNEVSILIDDSNTLLETQMDHTITEHAAPLGDSLSLLFDMSTRAQKLEGEARDRAWFFDSPIAFSSRFYRETETGFRPWNYHYGPLVGLPLAWTNPWAHGSGPRFGLWGRRPSKHYHRFCAYGVYANQHCVVGYGRENEYIKFVELLGDFKKIVSLIGDVFTAGGVSTSGYTMKQVSKVAAREISNEFVRYIEQEAQQAVGRSVSDSLDQATNAISAGMQHLYEGIDSQLTSPTLEAPVDAP